jgi:hypothetical protein
VEEQVLSLAARRQIRGAIGTGDRDTMEGMVDAAVRGKEKIVAQVESVMYPVRAVIFFSFRNP